MSGYIYLIVSDWMVHSCLWIVHEHSRAEVMCLSGSIYEDLDWGAGMYISNERSAEWYIRVSGIVNHLQWIFPFTRSTFRSTQCTGFFWKLLWLTHRRITDTCSHILSKASATHRGPGLNLSSRSWTDIFCCDTPDLPVPSSSMVVTHVCMHVCAWDWELVTLKQCHRIPKSCWSAITVAACWL